MFSDFNPAWDVLRRLTHVAIRKYAQTEKLAELVAHHVDLEVDELFEMSAQKKAIPDASDGDNSKVRSEIVEYVEDVINNVVAVSAFGEG